MNMDLPAIFRLCMCVCVCVCVWYKQCFIRFGYGKEMPAQLVINSCPDLPISPEGECRGGISFGHPENPLSLFLFCHAAKSKEMLWFIWLLKVLKEESPYAKIVKTHSLAFLSFFLYFFLYFF